MHLLRSKTQASWRREAVTFGSVVMALSSSPSGVGALLRARFLGQPLNVDEDGAVDRYGLPAQGPVLEVAVARREAQPLHHSWFQVGLAKPLPVHVGFEPVVDDDLSRPH